jgi:hypothetical protein
MRLVYKFLDHIRDVNDFAVLDTLTLVRGNPETVYFQLINKRSTDNSSYSDIRYMPDSTAQITITFDHIDSNAVITRVATMAYPSDDRSIWKVDILSTDKIAANGMKVSLSEVSGTKTRAIIAASVLVIEDSGSNRSYC